MYGRGYYPYNGGRGYNRGGRAPNGGGRGYGRGYNGRGFNSNPRKTVKKFVKDEIIPFNPKPSSERDYAKIERRVNNVTRKKKIPMFKDPSDLEQLCLTISEYLKAGSATQLHFNTEALLFEYFPQVLAPPMDTQWEALANPVVQPYADGDFMNTITQFLGLYVGNDGVDKQTKYMRSLRSKPHDMKVNICWLRIQTLNNYMSIWPNNPAHPDGPLTEHDQKIIFEGLMLKDWVNDAEKRGIRASDPNVDLDAMISFYQTCMDQYNEAQAKREEQQNRNTRGGRGNARGGYQDRRYSPYGYNQASSYYPQQYSANYPPRNPQGQYVPRGGGRGSPSSPPARGGYQSPGRFPSQAARGGGRGNYDNYAADPSVSGVASMPSMNTEESDTYHSNDMFPEPEVEQDSYHANDTMYQYEEDFYPPDSYQGDY